MSRFEEFKRTKKQDPAEEEIDINILCPSCDAEVIKSVYKRKDEKVMTQCVNGHICQVEFKFNV